MQAVDQSGDSDTEQEGAGITTLVNAGYHISKVVTTRYSKVKGNPILLYGTYGKRGPRFRGLGGKANCSCVKRRRSVTPPTAGKGGGGITPTHPGLYHPLPE
ncbi:hypothetical protein JTE90_011293 [Oedothorax gibbosus]|uniref:Uncharacterized protein n=1 Tax=Oedothorax gibbosus TaxID=931172 RepID=A0AAV6VK02_9ARAC|nr:hypothetical protein JTE90_011293 [Oedothorax gibbosus]